MQQRVKRGQRLCMDVGLRLDLRHMDGWLNKRDLQLGRGEQKGLDWLNDRVDWRWGMDKGAWQRWHVEGFAWCVRCNLH